VVSFILLPLHSINQITMAQLTQLQTEFLKKYLECFYIAYRNITGKKLQTLEELIEIIVSGKLTFEEVFDEYVSRCFGGTLTSLSNEEEDYYLANLEAFSHENYLTLDSKKDIGSGAWVKIRTERGYELHYAKPSTRKIRYNEVVERLQNKLINKLKKANNTLTLENLDSALKAVKDPEFLEAKLRLYIGLQPLQIRIQRNKNKTEYYLPYQYELVDDIQQYCDLYISKLPHLKVKTIATAINEDKIFYLQSRGISRRNAEIMAALNQSYFTFDLVGATETYNNFLKENLVVIEN
jgi:hypothetical protein